MADAYAWSWWTKLRSRLHSAGFSFVTGLRSECRVLASPPVSVQALVSSPDAAGFSPASRFARSQVLVLASAMLLVSVSVSVQAPVRLEDLNIGIPPRWHYASKIHAVQVEARSSQHRRRQKPHLSTIPGLVEQQADGGGPDLQSFEGALSSFVGPPGFAVCALPASFFCRGTREEISWKQNAYLKPQNANAARDPIFSYRWLRRATAGAVIHERFRRDASATLILRPIGYHHHSPSNLTAITADDSKRSL
ncbi:hypothetical protein EVG20_g6574 [Dentipellis fragilis]|uniref:Uncharacterized protein n=1 Tax=Dentipellis fragilis TaxID=205917 RepID=A0A4Y9YJT1_9AGAM|nr:hypothetical protein EVG20_g6574 [Dentipellis fragilis]